jgi:hypothetical protein
VASAGSTSTKVPSRRRVLTAAALLAALVAGAIAAALALGGGPAPPDDRAARYVPADALAYLNLSLDRRRPSVRQAVAVAARLPSFPALLAQARLRLAGLTGEASAGEFDAQIEPWLGDEAALALLNTSGSTAGSLLLLADRAPARARQFLASSGARASGSYRGVTLDAYPTGADAALVGPFLVAGQPASVRAAIDVARGAPALSASAPYRRAMSGQPATRVLEAYLPADGVRRLLLAQGGILGALGVLLDQPRLRGVAATLEPATGGFQVRVESALAPSAGTRAAPGFRPTLASALPRDTILMLDTRSLAEIAPRVLGAGATGGIAAAVGPLLSRLGAALRAEGVDVPRLLSLLSGESAVAVTDSGGRPALLVLARVGDPAAARAQLASLVLPLQRLFPSSAGVGSFTQRALDGVSIQQLTLSPGLALDYAVARDLVIISTSTAAIGQVIAHASTLAGARGYRAALAAAPRRARSLLYLDLSQLLGLGERTGLTQSAGFRTLRADLGQIHTIVLASTGAGDNSTAELYLQIK